MDTRDAQPTGHEMWRAIGEFRQGHAGPRDPEFAFGAGDWMPGMDRREFLRLMGASLALGGVTGCIRPSPDRLVPYVTPPEDAPMEDPLFYATAMSVEGYGRGIVVETHFGRPTKLEGNPDHPESRGTSDAMTQAAILGLYDPDRSRTPLFSGRPSGWSEFDGEWRRRLPGFQESRGEGIALLTEPATSPTFLREIGLFLEEFPRAQWYQHTPLAVYAQGPLQPDYDVAAARVILALGSDFLFRHPASLRYAREFAESRRKAVGIEERPRLYSIESSPTPTGSMADLRLPASPARMRAVLGAVASALGGDAPAANGKLTAAEVRFVAALVADLRSHAPNVLCIAGAEQGEDVRHWAFALNSILGAAGRTSTFAPSIRSDNDPRSRGRVDALAGSLRAGAVQALFVLSSNPGYTVAAFEGGDLLGRAPLTVHLGSHVDETGSACGWHLPEAHFLETWGDLRGYDGSATLQQPMIEPLFGGRSAIELLHQIRTGEAVPGYELVRATWAGLGSPAAFEVLWAAALSKGVVDAPPGSALPAPDTRGVPATALPILTINPDLSGLELVLVPDPTVGDGRWSNNAWLQELPKPLTQLVWDNAALLSPSLAKGLGVSNGDMLLLSAGGARVEAAAWIMPGHAPGCVTLSLGYGRAAAGSNGNGRGFNAYPLRTSGQGWEMSGLVVTPTGRKYELVSTQRHFSMEGRNPVRTLDPRKLTGAAPDPTASLYPDWKAGTYSWGMSIDLGACTGCNACVAACQAENNIPVVGKDQVSREREMHWIRIDRYYDGDADAPLLLSQPVTCMHCEKAPCEVVCPVGATVHNAEGLNEMVYNRCVGTRYCSNNCPYKVRRFNFLDYQAKADSPLNLQKNPDVTVRERGVMEKCSYCVQRINAARIAASKADRPVRDGEIRTACQQACPSQAIVFGNVADPSSAVARLKASPASYSLLGELNTHPRTTYLARLAAEPS
jgi:Fe-S-cluster-containing dehydrogenase component